MENESKLSQWLSRIGDKLNEQVWFQQLKAKWEELDPQSRTYLKAAGGVGAVLLVMIIVFSSLWNVHKLKVELAEKQDLVNQIESANAEMRRLRESTPSAEAPQGGLRNANEAPAWPAYFEQTAAGIGVDKASLTVGGEAQGATTEQAKETLFDLSLKHVNIKQVVRYAFQLENGSRPVKLRNLLIDTKADPTGYMDATLSVSAFALK